MKKLIVISVGGSLIVPDKIDVNFLKEFHDLIVKYVEKGVRFIIITGGGKTARNYQDAAKHIHDLRDYDVDWLGIYGTRVNAHLLRAIFYKFAHNRVLKNLEDEIKFKEKVLISGGWKPGFSTDYCSIILAKHFNVKSVVNLTNTDYVFNKDPKKHSNARPIKEISWDNFIKMMPKKWSPGLNVPFDPVASREAKNNGIEVNIIHGKSLKNLENYLNGRRFVGTKIK
ncbi:MAG: UMP kinase [archaeon]